MILVLIIAPASIIITRAGEEIDFLKKNIWTALLLYIDLVCMGVISSARKKFRDTVLVRKLPFGLLAVDLEVHYLQNYGNRSAERVSRPIADVHPPGLRRRHGAGLVSAACSRSTDYMYASLRRGRRENIYTVQVFCVAKL